MYNYYIYLKKIVLILKQWTATWEKTDSINNYCLIKSSTEYMSFWLPRTDSGAEMLSEVSASVLQGPQWKSDETAQTN